MSATRIHQFSLVISLGFVACSHQVDSPAPSVSSIEPSLVCNAQRVSPDAIVTLNGDGFTPMSRNVLAEPSVLVLPSVTITKTQDLSGGAATGTEIEFSGEPEEKFANNLTWESQQLMTFRVSEEPPIALDAGLYDITVMNPDGLRETTTAQGLAVVDPPRIDDVAPVPQALCTEQSDRQLVITGENLLVVAGAKPTVSLIAGDTTIDLAASAITMDGCTTIPGEFAGGTVELCTSITATLAAGVVPAGTYSLTVTSPEPASCASAEAPSVVIVDPPLATNVLPPTICVEQSDTTITIEGGNFARITTGDNAGDEPVVAITAVDGTRLEFAPDSLAGCVPPTDLDATFGLELCDSLTFTVSQDALLVGNYEIEVTNPDPVSCVSVDTMNITVSPPPTVESIAPATVCSGGSVVTVTGTGFLANAGAELRCPNSSVVTATGVDVISSTEADVTFGPGINVGETCDLVIINADTCEDTAPHQTVVGTDGPILFNVDPHVAFNGINTKVQLYVTAVLPPFTVEMWSGTDQSTSFPLTAALAAGRTNVIDATVPAGLAVGPYTIAVQDSSGCFASFQTAVTITDTTVVSTGTVVPSFGLDSINVPITISLGSDPGATGTPRAFLNPAGDAPAVQLQSVTVLDANTLTAVVPAGTPPGLYELVIVWPDSAVAVIADAYTSTSTAPPVIDDVVPQSVVAGENSPIEIRGTDFVSSDVTLRCQTGSGVITMDASEVTEICAAGACTQTATLIGSQLDAGDVCVVRVTNSDGSFGEFSAIGVTGSSDNLEAPVLAETMNTARRALTASAVKATGAARFIYAVGGDDGDVANAMNSVEFAPIGIFGEMNAWQETTPSMGTARAFAGSATIGRYVYVFGGNDGSGALSSSERALVLSPEEIPTINTVDLCLSGSNQDCFGVPGLSAGLSAGLYSYRVSAVIDGADPVNLGGETLSSDPIIVQVRDVDGRTVTVQLDWTAPKDSEGADLSGIINYRIYRTPQDGVPGTDETLLGTVDGATLTFIDDGSDTLGTDTPVVQGSTSDWQALPNLGVTREGPAGAAAVDPADPSTWYVYALLGRDGDTGRTTYEYLDVSIASNGRQSVGVSWTTGVEESAVGRWQFGSWTVDSVTASAVTGGDTWVYLGGGMTATGGDDSEVEAALVNTGGELRGEFGDFPNGTGDTSVTKMSPVRVGYGTAAAAGRLFAFGGLGNGSSAVAAGLDDTDSFTAPLLESGAWNSEGWSFTQDRYLSGSAIQSAFIFLIGGADGGGATATTETVVW